MSDVAERYRRLAGAFADRIAKVEGDAWSSPSPCAGWSAIDVVDHVVQTQGMFLGFIGRELGEIPAAKDDPAASWDAARGLVQGCLDDPAVASTEFQGFAGPTTFERAASTFLCTDLVVHVWDLARATGQNEAMAPADIAQVRADMEPLGDNLRGPLVFGPEVEAPDGASEQDRLLAFLGRNP